MIPYTLLSRRWMLCTVKFSIRSPNPRGFLGASGRIALHTISKIEPKVIEFRDMLEHLSAAMVGRAPPFH